MTTTSVTNGNTLTNSSIAGGDTLVVKSGGAIIDYTILNGGSAVISGTDSGSTIDAGGSETVFGLASGDAVYGTQVVNSTGSLLGTVTNETIYNGGTVNFSATGAVGSALTVSSGGVLITNARAAVSDVVIDGGTVMLASKKSTVSDAVTFGGHGTLEETAVISASGATLYGDTAVLYGFDATDLIDLTALSGGALSTSVYNTSNTLASVTGTSGGTSYTETFIFSGLIGDELSVGPDAGGTGTKLAFTSQSTTTVPSGATDPDAVIGDGQMVIVQAGGTLLSATILNGGSAVISAGATDSATTIQAGGGETDYGAASGDVVLGTQLVSGSLATVSQETIGNGGIVEVYDATASFSGLTIEAAGTLALSGGVAGTDLTISGGGVVLETAGDTLAGTVTFAGAGTITLDTLPDAGAGLQAIVNGFTVGDVIDDAAIGAGAALSTSTSGSDTVATVTSGTASQSVTFAGTSVASHLALIPDSNGGEEIVYQPPVPASLTAFTAGDIVLSISGDGDGSSYYGDNQATPMVLEEVTASGSIVGIFVMPQTATVVNGVTEYAVSSEYGSSSEGILELSADGQSLVIGGYGINAATYNAGGAAVYGNAALAQSTSLLGGIYTAVPRIAASIGYDGTINTSTALYDIFNTNNPRSVASVNGTTFYLSGQGVKGDTTQGVFLAQNGASTPIAIDNSSDTRTAEISGNTLYVSRDSTQGSSNTNIGAYGGLPTGPTAATTLPGIAETVTLTAQNANTVNGAFVGQSVYLSPEAYFFASSTVLYVADGGNPKNGGIGDGGLQKWVLSNGTWTLAYTLSVGLNLVADTNPHGTSGLIGLTGTVTGNTVQLYATNEGISDLDQTYLYGITDQLSASAPSAGETFTALVTASPDTNIRGVAFAPRSATTISGVTDVASGSTVSNLVVSGGAANALTVEASGVISGAQILNSGSAVISGADDGSTISAGGTETVAGTAYGDQVHGTQIVVAGGSVSLEDVYDGGTIALDEGAAGSSLIVFSGGSLTLAGNAHASDVVISGGAVVDLLSDTATLDGALTFAGSGGTLLLSTPSGAGDGVQALVSGFAAGDVIDETQLGTGSMLQTTSGSTSAGVVTIATITSGSVVETLTFAGLVTNNLSLTPDGGTGVEIVYTGAPPVTYVGSGVTSKALTISGGQEVIVQAGGTLASSTILSGGLDLMNGIETGLTLRAGANETVYGSASLDTIYGTQLVSAATAVVSDETVHAGGIIDLFLKGAQANAITLEAGGALNISGNASATDTVIDGGTLALQSSKSVLAGSVQFHNGGTLLFESLTSASYGDLAVISNFATGDVIEETVFAGGAAFTTTTSGGNTVATFTSGNHSQSVIIAGLVADHLSSATSQDGHAEILSDQPGVPCYAAGTRILTERGEVMVEALAVGDRVITASGATRPVRWLGHRRIDLARHARPDEVRPIVVRAGAFADGVPARDLWLSPGHNVVVEDALVPISALCNGRTVAQIECPAVTYWHVELDAHDIMIAEGLPAESYLDTGNRSDFANAGVAITPHPAFAPHHWSDTCLPLVFDGPLVTRARARLIERAKVLGNAITAEDDVHIMAGGRRVDPVDLGAGRIGFMLPETSGTVTLRSRCFIPRHVDASSGDARPLGVCVKRLQINGVDVALDGEAMLGQGWHALEQHPDGWRQRWTGGEVTLPAGTRMVLIERAGRGYFWEAAQRDVVALFG